MSTVTIDEGWAWAVPAGGFIANFIVGGLAKSYGIIMKSTQELYYSNSAPLTVAGGLIYTFMYSLSLIGIFLSQKYGCRVVVNIGALGCVLSFIGAFFSKTVTMWVICIGGGVGISLAFIYSLIFVMVGRCFRKRVGVAMGISVAGVSVGQMAFPHIISHVIDVYSARGAFLIGGGIACHFFITAALMPRFIYSEELEKKRKNNNKSSISKKSLNDSVEKIPLNDMENGNLPIEDCTAQPIEKPKKKSTFTNIHIVMLVLFIIAKIFGDIGDVGVAFILPSFGEDSLGLDNQEISSAIAVAGGVDLVARIFVGLISDQDWCRRSVLLTFAWLLEAINTGFFMLFPDKTSFYVLYGIFGLTSGTAITLMTVVLTDLVGHTNLPISFAAMMLAVGLFIAPGQFLVGYLRDVTKTSVWSLWFLAINLFIAFFIMALEYPIKKLIFGTTAATDVKFTLPAVMELPSHYSKEENEDLVGMPTIIHRDPNRDIRSRLSSISTLSNVDVLEILTLNRV